jgi:hypothetical protein
MATAGPSTAPFAKCANGFAQDDMALMMRELVMGDLVMGDF